MWRSAPARTVFLIGFVLGFVLMGSAFFSGAYNVLLFTLGLMIFVGAFFSAQVLHAFLALREEERRRKRQMTPCQNCQALLYPEETVCPYCQTRRKEDLQP